MGEEGGEGGKREGGGISDLAVKISMRSHHDSGKVTNYKTCRKLSLTLAHACMHVCTHAHTHT